MPKAVVLLSGGMDSAVALAEAKAAGFEAYALSFDYGQRHRAELRAAARVASSLQAAKHVVIALDLRVFGGSALTADIAVPKDRIGDGAGNAEIPVTYVPARNTIFLSVALGYAETLGAHDIFIGVNAIDYSGYPDCRPEFIEAFERMANLGTKRGVESHDIRVRTPLAALSKRDIVRRGIALGVDFGLTLTCYDPVLTGDRAAPCGHCDACILRMQGFREAGVADPALA
ncbi:MAG: 7-cyano-7-deazaguanine synthase QueC [Phycisphaerae bacterium]|nr:7-cyano-7-deazaguanine synthase QueC [Phycisphaerae bacterium]